MNEGNLRKLWDNYALAGYEKVYSTNSTKQLRRIMSDLFLELESSNSKVVDLGCGTGGLFKTVVQRICPGELVAVDWSQEMLTRAREEALRVQAHDSGVRFEFILADLTKPLVWENNTFDSVIANLVICYLPGGWREPIKELHRITKPGGNLYLSTFTNEWDFPSAVWRFAPREFLRAPIATLYGIRFRNIAARISEQAKASDAEYPARGELTEYLEQVGFLDIVTSPIYWGFGLALRATKAST
jgi:ubiquinone/menaquinone biosynthesis C-methylase UbiE